MKQLFTFLLLFICLYCFAQQRIIAECTITFNLSTIDTTATHPEGDILKSSSKTIYIKGNEARTDLISSAFCQTTIYNKTDEEATILRAFGNNKFITKLDKVKWLAFNKKYEGLTLEKTSETKTIVGYNCKRAILHLKDGHRLEVFYTTSIIPSVKEFEYQFKDVPGLVLSYESVGDDGVKINYTATKINLSPVLATLFKIPTSGYRVL